jgi:hypothetical protein
MMVWDCAGAVIVLADGIDNVQHLPRLIVNEQPLCGAIRVNCGVVMSHPFFAWNGHGQLSETARPEY